MSIIEERLINGRRAIDLAGGVSKVAAEMGYANASFLVQIFGPNPTRAPSDKMMRKLERTLGLPERSLDAPAAPPLPSATSVPLNTAQLARGIQLVSQISDEEAVRLGSDRLASIIAMGYEDAAENDGQPRESRLRQVVRLLR